MYNSKQNKMQVQNKTPHWREARNMEYELESAWEVTSSHSFIEGRESVKDDRIKDMKHSARSQQEEAILETRRMYV